jgi:mRNA-degrading endonuclease toxin of MazEF toxin-antitoxin module
MPLPEAVPGLVFRYEYTWKRQALAGQTVGEKDRPACVVLSIVGKTAMRRVLIVPITTRFPGDEIPAIEIPRRVKSHLGLDADISSWIILSEANLDTWPTPDMRQIPGKPGCFEYGLLPEKMVNAIWAVVKAGLQQKQLLLVDRDPGLP